MFGEISPKTNINLTQFFFENPVGLLRTMELAECYDSSTAVDDRSVVSTALGIEVVTIQHCLLNVAVTFSGFERLSDGEAESVENFIRE